MRTDTAETYHPTETRRTLRNLTSAALEWRADTGGVPVVLVHGWLDHAGTWTKVASHLEGWLVAPDLRGHGHSGRCGPADSYHVAEYIADLDALVTSLGGRAHVVGHSLGGAVVTMWAGARPDRAASVTVVDGLGLADAGAGAVGRMREFLDGASAPLRSPTLADVAEAARRLRAHHPFLSVADAHALAARGTVSMEGGLRWAWDPRHRLRTPMPYRQDAHARFLAEIRAPLVVVRPSRSPFAEEDHARLLAACPRATVIHVEDAGHMVPLEAPEAVAAAVRTAVAASVEP